MKESDRTPRWWGVYEAAVTGLACGGGCAEVVDDAVRIADLSLSEGTPKLAELRGTVQKVEKKGGSHLDRPTLMAQILVGDGDTISVIVPPTETLQPGDKVVCSVTLVR
jgi:hypothetical protein